MRILRSLCLPTGCLAMALMSQASTANADNIIPASDDTIILDNATPSEADSSDGEDNFGGRNEVILGAFSGNRREALFRFDVSAVAAQINGGQPLTDAKFIINEKGTGANGSPNRNGNNGTLNADFTIEAVAGGNAGWVEGTRVSSAGGFSGELGSVSQTYLATPTDATATDGLLWLSQGGGATGTFPGADGFTFGTDTTDILGTENFTFTTGTNDELVIDLDLATLQTLLPTWLADPTGNAGLALRASGASQLFFASNETGAGGNAPARLDLTFGPVTGVLLGDVDRNGEVNFLDISPFIAVLSGGSFQAEADCDENGVVDFLDISPFIEILSAP